MPSPEDATTIAACIMGVDEAARLAEAEWGIGRLPLLVDDDMRAKFMRQADRLNAALEVGYGSPMLTKDQLEAVQKAAGAMQRAWAALGAKARENGHTPLEPDIWEAVLQDGSIACIVRTNADASKVIRDGRALNVWTLDEVARAIDLMPEMVRSVKETFPGATVLPAKERARGRFEPDTEIPF